MLQRTTAAFLALVLLGGCTKIGGGGERRRANSFTQPHVLRYANVGDVVTLNPLLNTELTVSWMASLAMAWLVRFDRHNKPVPELATEVPTQANGGVSRDGKTLTYHLRRDAKWSDGAPFTADDVAFTTRLVLDPHTNVTGRDGWNLISKIDEPDKYTIVFHLKKPYSSFLVTFFGSAGATPCVLPKHVLEHTKDINRDPYNSKPIGIGPFRFVEWRRGDRVILEANPYYFRGLPKLKRIEYRAIPNRDTIVIALQTGDIDMWPIAARAYYPRLKAIKGFEVLRQTGYGFGHLDFNLARAKLADPRVRHALIYAIDRKTLIDKVAHGIGLLQDAVMSPASPFFDPSIPTTPYDPAKANALLEAAGWVRGADGIRVRHGVRLSIELVSNTGSPDTDTQIELIRGWWKAVGVDLQRKNYDTNLLFAQMQNGGIIYSGKFDVVFFAWFLGPSGDLSNIYGCDQMPPNGQNSLHWCNRRAQAAMEAFKTTFDFSKQKKLDDIIQEEIAKDAPTMVSYISEDLFAYNSDLKNFHPNAVSIFDDMMNVDI